ncbi:dehydrogenase, partial [Halalkalibaculum sp. DA384]
QQEHDELFAAIRNGEQINDTENGAKSTLTALLGRMATYSGDVIGWEETPPVVPGPDGTYPVPVPGRTEVV